MFEAFHSEFIMNVLYGYKVTDNEFICTVNFAVNRSRTNLSFYVL